MKQFSLAAILALVSSAEAFDVSTAHLFNDYVLVHGKSYATKEEYQMRMELFSKTNEFITAFNADPTKTSTVGHNIFSDMTEEEKRSYRGYQGPKSMDEVAEPNYYDFSDVSDIPDAINWIEKGAVNPVQNQAQCGSCWAFSAIAQIEGAHFLKTGELIKLSEQMCVDCDTKSYGCNGGWQENCMEYAMWDGLDLETDYPYEAITDTCWPKYDNTTKVDKIYHVKGHIVAELKAAIAQGPVSVTIDADQSVFHQYTSGVITGKECGTALDHAVTAVGYGEENGTPYYLVRNSWGTAWGDNGYVKIGQEEGYGVCGIQEISVWSTAKN